MSEKEESKTEKPVKIEELTPNSKSVNTTVRVVSKGEVRNVTGRDYNIRRVADALVGDETGCLYLTLWENKIDEISEGNTIRITNGYINLFRGNMRLNVGKYGSLEIMEESPIEEVKTENNLSDKRYERERRFRSYGDRRRSQRRGF
ncbi:MAG: single-stranded DNA-binding protein [Candidatus Bathyarchaeota archaeon]|nr:MAG: single-stranded DNA-binding protein [Candidatus Bathyarchaeota archaeon]